MIPALLVSALASVAQAIAISGPTGPYAVSMDIQALTDSGRLDPYAPADDPHSRQVLISTFIPVNETETPCRRRHTTPYMTPLVAAAYDQLGVFVGLPNGTFSSLELEFCAPKTSRCRSKVPSYPLVLFSPGAGNPRLLYGAMAREVASHGFAVVTIDHPYDASFVEFPDGTVFSAVSIDDENSTAIELLTKVRAEDTSFVLSHLSENPVRGIDLTKVIMFGHSLGGATAATAMLSDPRIRGGINLDGRLPNPVKDAGLDGPFVLVGRPGHADEDQTWDVFYEHLRGPRSHLEVKGTLHGSFTDFPTLIQSLHLTLPDEAKALLESQIGTLEFGRAGQVVAGIVSAFADAVLNGKAESLFTIGDEAIPEVEVVRAEM
ncbi:related to PAF acetylhydrolase family protein [Cephalotrichum gorgonifer]|uniref:1-alkyl-2-acetylglycerophosphocholine esterase n=1 Tax=Cephalotrichum gorgonifer TaxID=2041049 RepID=A0AAE8SU97_9PEZI|nr:related to PAF acetylhydrolase family protein [Cephalotrichum gorgonifer]